MSLDRALVLNRYFHSLFGASRFEDLKRLLRETQEGQDQDAQSHFFHTLVGLNGLKIARDDLAEYDARVVSYEQRLIRNRRVEPVQSFKYFQYLALLYSEIFLDRLTNDPAMLLAELNRFRAGHADFAGIPDFEPDDLRRLAFFMATGSGKTLLMHINVWQVLYYLEHGAHPEALVRRADGRREFDHILLITPGEGLSDQHLKELDDSQLHACRFIEDRGGMMFGPTVKVIEIHKLADEATGEGVSVPIEQLRDTNLVLVDEGHKGTGSEARVWKSRQQALSKNGFLLEYSATFAQAIGAAPPRARGQLLGEYGKAILFDYSYRYFYGDGFGKSFRVLNLKKARVNQAHDLMLGGLLLFYQQARLFHAHGEQFRPYKVEKPLWVLLGTTVSRKKANERDGSKTAETERTDVAEAVAFLRRFLEEPKWAIECIEKTLEGESGFDDPDDHFDLFKRHLTHLPNTPAEAIYKRICRDLFHGQGGLEVCELKKSGEIGLRSSAGGSKELPYFAVINIGDVPAFKKHLHEKLGIETKDDYFSGSLFDAVKQPDSPIHVLIGAKKFIEGWSSWRVSAMGLLNVGKGEGSQVIQLFGRGVRLKGRDKSLKRSERLPGPHPDGLQHLETLFIFGWNADYIQIFRETLEREDLATELPPFPVKHQDPWPDWLWVPKRAEGYDPKSETWIFDDTGRAVTVDLRPQLTAVSSAIAGDGLTKQRGFVGRETTVQFSEPPYSDVIDVDALTTELVEYKSWRGYGNIFIPRSAVRRVLQSRCEIRMLEDDAANPDAVHRVASRALKTYLDRLYRRNERQAESDNAEPRQLDRERQVVGEYCITVYPDGEEDRRLLEQLERMRNAMEEWHREAPTPLPRLHLDFHLFNPLVVAGDKACLEVRPPGLVPSEQKFVRSLREFWQENYAKPPYVDLKVFVLRNLPKVGIGLFSGSGFYPDFILWFRNLRTDSIHVRLLDPHGLHHGGLGGSDDKFEALNKLKELSQRQPFKDHRITIDGFLLVATPLEQIPDRRGREFADLEREYPLLHQSGSYLQRALCIP